MAGAGVIAWWTSFYATHDTAQLISALGHLGAIAYAMKHAIAGDRAALRLTRSPQRSRRAPAIAHDVTCITGAHAHVLTGLAFALLTGLAQLAAQLDYLPQSPIFWTKMTALCLLLANGRLIQLTGRRAADAVARESAADAVAQDRAAVPGGPGNAHTADAFRGLRAAAVRSIILWCTMLLLGLLLTTVRPDG